MKRLSFVPVATVLAAAAWLAGCATPPASQGGLARIAETKAVTFGYREDARPFSYQGSDGKPDGYSVELCRRVADALKGQLGLTQLDVRWQPVTVATRMQAVTDGRVDIECGSTSRTFGREQQVDFSNPTWVEGASFVALPASGLRLAKDLNGKRVGVVAGTTTEAALKHLATRGITPVFVPVATHTDGIAAVRDGRADAYATDRLILIGETLGARGPDAAPGRRVHLVRDLRADDAPRPGPAPRGEQGARRRLPQRRGGGGDARRLRSRRLADADAARGLRAGGAAGLRRQPAGCDAIQRCISV